MHEQRQRHFAAIIACAVTATWTAAGGVAALATIAATALAYGAVAFVQQHSRGQSSFRRAVGHPASRAPRRPRTAAERAVPTARRHDTARATERSIFDDDLAEASSGHSLTATGQYGW